MSRKSKGECTCKIVAQNERGIIAIGHCGHHLETAGTARRAVSK